MDGVCVSGFWGFGVSVKARVSCLGFWGLGFQGFQVHGFEVPGRGSYTNPVKHCMLCGFLRARGYVCGVGFRGSCGPPRAL